jgi:hypothetical protein
MKTTLTLYLLFIFAQDTFCQADYSSSLTKIMDEEEVGLQEWIIPHLPSKDQDIYKEIEIIRPGGLNSGPGPRAYIDENGTRVIEFGLAFYRELEGAVDAFLIQGVLNKPGFFKDYFDYIRSRRGTKGEWPTVYAGLSEEETRAFYNLPDVKGYRGGLIMSAHFSVLLHELGHHVLGHLESPPRNLAESRSREMAADEYSCQALMDNGFIPLGAVVSLSLLYALREGDIVYEGQETHPAEIRRLDYTCQFIVDNIDEYKERFKERRVPFQAFKEQLSKWVSQIRDSYSIETR